MKTHSISRGHLVHASVEELWDFISNPDNLEKLTPATFKTKRTGDTTIKRIQEGSCSSYKIRLFPLVYINWDARFINVKDKEEYTDVQVAGPFKRWEHQHQIISQNNQTFMRDIITFEPPFSMIGSWLVRVFIKPRIQYLFNYRDKQFDVLFPKQSVK